MTDYFSTADDISAHDEQTMFLKTLHHDVRGGHTFLLKIEDGSKITQLPKYKGGLFSCTKTDANYYVSVNSFKKYSRKNNDIFNLTNIVLDLDWHSDEVSLDIVCTELNEIWNKKQLLPPTMIVYSGRGLHLYYTLKNSVPYTSKAGVNLFEKTRDALYDRYNELLNGILAVDYATKDFARVMRLPGTINQANGEIARLLGLLRNESNEICYYDLPEIISGCKLVFETKIDVSDKLEQEEIAPKIFSQNAFAAKRLKQLQKLLELRDYDIYGFRDLYLLAVYCAAVQISDRKTALDKIIALNMCLKNPLSQSKAVNIIAGLDGDAFYKLSNDWLINNLCITDDEAKIIFKAGVISSKEKRAKAKEHTKAKKEKRNELILELAKEGMLYQDIADRVCCSLRTVKSVLKEAGFAKYAKCDGTEASETDVRNQICEFSAANNESAKNCYVCIYINNNNAVVNLATDNLATSNLATSNLATSDLATSNLSNIIFTCHTLSNVLLKHNLLQANSPP